MHSLFSPISIGEMILKNRIVMAPMVINFATVFIPFVRLSCSLVCVFENETPKIFPDRKFKDIFTPSLKEHDRLRKQGLIVLSYMPVMTILLTNFFLPMQIIALMTKESSLVWSRLQRSKNQKHPWLTIKEGCFQWDRISRI